MQTAESRTVLSRFSTVTALLALSLTILFFLPTEPSRLNFFIANIEFAFSLIETIPFFIAVIGLIGSFWILIANPDMNKKTWLIRQILPHCVLPSVTIFIFAQILLATDKGFEWWGILIVGLIAFSFVIYAEYQVIKPETNANTIFTLLLIALAHALFMAFAIALRASVSRVFVLVPAISIAVVFVSYRSVFLRTSGQFQSYWILVVVLICAQCAIGLYYLFLTPIQFGLLLTAILFISNGLVARIGQKDYKNLYIEPLVLGIFVVLMFLLSKLI